VPEIDWSNSTLVEIKTKDFNEKTVVLESCISCEPAKFELKENHGFCAYGELQFKDKVVKAFATEI